jgi:Arc/MetJ family transcription regulator
VYTLLARADGMRPLDRNDSEWLTILAYLTGRDLECLKVLERTHHVDVAAGHEVRAARSAFWLALPALLRGDMAGVPTTPAHASTPDAIASAPPARHRMPYNYGIVVCMKKTLHIDERLLRDARSASGAKTDTETVRLGLEALVRHSAYERLRALRGSEPSARDIRRRRERASSAKHSAA